MKLGQFDDAQREAVLGRARRLAFARNAAIFAAGDPAHSVYFIIAGRVKIVRTSASGAESIVEIRDRGELFGELTSLVTGEPRRTSAFAIEPAEIAAVNASDFFRALGNDADLARLFARAEATRLAEAVLDLTELAGKSVTGRLVDALGRLSQRHGKLQPDGTLHIGINLTHKDLADLIGTSRETLTKELGVLADAGLLRVAHKTITLVQPRAFPFATGRR